MFSTKELTFIGYLHFIATEDAEEQGPCMSVLTVGDHQYNYQ